MTTAMILNMNSRAKGLEPQKTCPVCEEGTLTERSEMNHFVRNGIFVQADCYFSICNHCGSEQASGEQIDRNNELAFKAYNEALMNLQGESNIFA